MIHTPLTSAQAASDSHCQGEFVLECLMHTASQFMIEILNTCLVFNSKALLDCTGIGRVEPWGLNPSIVLAQNLTR